MCGIVGIVGRRKPVSAEILERATRSLAHRGPDDSGAIIVRPTAPEPVEIGLGNRRLAILDLSPLGHQPMHDPATGNWIVFNGEIYNFLQVRKELEGEGLIFSSNSDTEVLLKAYGRWGEGCLDRLRGMFAFAIWDAPRQRLFLARDPIGIKPLYYYFSDQYFLFASELRTLLGTGLIPRRLDSAGLLNYLAFGSVYDPNTLIEGISALLPGHYLIWQNGKQETHRYWDLVSEEGRAIANVAEKPKYSALNEIRGLLLDSVRLHLVSDVPVGVFLSGGIDSSSLVALLTEMGVRPHTFSLVFREPDYSEAGYSREIAREFGTEHQEVCVAQGDALEQLPGALRAMDQPTIDGVNTYIVSHHAQAAGMKVVLSGLGGDEMFAGYSNFRSVPRMERFARYWRHVPGLLRSATTSAVSWTGDSDQSRKLAALLRNPDEIVPCFLARMLFTPEQVRHLLPAANEDVLGRAKAPLMAMFERSRPLDPVNRVSYLETRGYMANTLLRDADVMSMAHSLELRVPLLDPQLAVYLQTVPGAWKTNNRMPKPLLVGTLERKLPDAMVYRRKQGFTFPFEHWLKDEMRVTVAATLKMKHESYLSSILEVPAVQSVWMDFLAGRTSWSRPWSLYVLSQWCDAHL